MYTRNCPRCNGIMKYSSKDSLRGGTRRNSICCGARSRQHKVGQLHSEESKQKISKTNKGKAYNKSNLGKKQSPEWIEKRSNALKGRVPGFIGKKHKSKTKLKMSKRRSEMLRERFGEGQISPWYNKKACGLFDEINRVMGWNGQHAENGGEFYVDGFWVDYYEPHHNIVIEYDEKRHKIPSVITKDKLRQQHIMSVLKCDFFRIEDGSEKKWKQILSKYTVD